MTKPELSHLDAILSQAEYALKVLRFRLHMQGKLETENRFQELERIEREALFAYHRCKLVDLKTAFRLYEVAEKARRAKNDLLAQQQRNRFFIVRNNRSLCDE